MPNTLDESAELRQSPTHTVEAPMSKTLDGADLDAIRASAENGCEYVTLPSETVISLLDMLPSVKTVLKQGVDVSPRGKADARQG